MVNRGDLCVCGRRLRQRGGTLPAQCPSCKLTLTGARHIKVCACVRVAVRSAWVCQWLCGCSEVRGYEVAGCVALLFASQHHHRTVRVRFRRLPADVPTTPTRSSAAAAAAASVSPASAFSTPSSPPPPSPSLSLSQPPDVFAGPYRRNLPEWDSSAYAAASDTALPVVLPLPLGPGGTGTGDPVCPNAVCAGVAGGGVGPEPVQGLGYGVRLSTELLRSDTQRVRVRATPRVCVCEWLRWCGACACGCVAAATPCPRVSVGLSHLWGARRQAGQQHQVAELSFHDAVSVWLLLAPASSPCPSADDLTDVRPAPAPVP